MASLADPSTQRKNEVTVESLCEILIEKYGKPESDFALQGRVRDLERAFSGLSNCKGKKILDLGCGIHRGAAEVDNNPGVWAPWLCRAVVELEGSAVGIDIGMVLETEKFEYHRIDLLDPRALDQFDSHSFDAINCTNLLSSPDLVYRQTGMDKSQREAMRDILEVQIERLLKKEGVLIDFDKNLDNY